jgi:hypothetical protein
MITNGIVINDLKAFDKIVSFAERNKEYLVSFYREEYGTLVDTLGRYASKFRENLSMEGFEQNVISFSLRATTMFKTILYLYLNRNIPTISKSEMQFITSVLSRLDEWIDEEMNTNEYYISGVVNYKIDGEHKSSYYD